MKKIECADFGVKLQEQRREMEQGETEGNDTNPNMEPERVESSGGREPLTTPTPLEVRPVTVSGFLYNLGAGTRFVDVIRWCTNLVAQICGRRHSRTSHSKVCMDCVVGNGRRRGRSCHGGNLTRPSSSTRGEL